MTKLERVRAGEWREQKVERRQGKGRVGRREGGREEEKGGNESATDPQTRSGRSRPAPDQQLCPHGNSNTAVSIAPPRLLPALAPATPNGPSRSLPCADRPHSHVRGFPRLSVVPVAPGKTPPQVTLGRSAFPPPGDRVSDRSSLFQRHRLVSCPPPVSEGARVRQGEREGGSPVERNGRLLA